MSLQPVPITSLPLQRRAINALTRGGIASLDEAQAWSDEALLSLPQFGPAFLTQLRNLGASNFCHLPTLCRD